MQKDTLLFVTSFVSMKTMQKKYGVLKELVAERFPNDIEAYIDGKNDLVKSLEQKAIKWHRERI